MNKSTFILFVSKIKDGSRNVFKNKVNFDDPSNEKLQYSSSLDGYEEGVKRLFI